MPVGKRTRFDMRSNLVGVASMMQAAVMQCNAVPSFSIWYYRDNRSMEARLLSIVAMEASIINRSN